MLRRGMPLRPPAGRRGARSPAQGARKGVRMTRKLIHPAVVTGAAVAVTAMMTAAAAGTAPRASQAPATATPIKHVVVIIGENHSFDNVFATYQPPGGQKIRNLLAEGIITKNGDPGPNFKQAAQLTASNTKTYSLNPKITGAYPTLPRPNTTYVSPGCDGQAPGSPDARFPANLPFGPYQITKYVPYFDDHLQYTGGCEFYGAYVGDPLHRFYQMWQQYGSHHGQLNTWVANTAGDGTGANHIALGTGFAASYQDSTGKAVPPPAGEIENPNPKPGTNNNYAQDGYGSSTTPNTGGSYSNCADSSQPGVGVIDKLLTKLPYKPLAK